MNHLQIIYESNFRILTVDAPGDISLYDDLSVVTGCIFEHLTAQRILDVGIAERPGAVVMFTRGGSARKRSLQNTFSVIRYLREQFGNIKITVLFLGTEFKPVIEDVKRLRCEVGIGPGQSESIFFRAMQACSMPELDALALIIRRNKCPFVKLPGVEGDVEQLRGRLLELLVYLATEPYLVRSRREIATRLGCPEDQVKMIIWRLNQVLALICQQTKINIKVRNIGRDKGFVLEIKNNHPEMVVI